MKKQRATLDDYNKREKEKYKARVKYWAVYFPKAGDLVERVITNNGSVDWKQLEIAARFTIDNRDVMSRKTTYTRKDDLLLYCQAKNPHSLELGGVYPAGFEDRADQRKVRRLINITGPLVIDIDMDDYHCKGLRSGICNCAKKEVCRVCWNILLEPGRKVLDMLLRKSFGFKQLFYIFSGRRGYHCWIVDDRVWNWTREQRETFMVQLSHRPRGGCLVSNQIVNMLKPVWKRELLQNPNSTTNTKMKELRLAMPEEEYMEAEKQAIWDALFPKLDADVSLDACHLKKIFLSPHLKTQRVTIPLPPFDCEFEFDPLLHVPQMKDIDMYMMDQYVQQIENALNNSSNGTE